MKEGDLRRELLAAMAGNDNNRPFHRLYL